MGLPKDTPEEVLVEQAITQLSNLFQQQTDYADTAAIFVEPVMGEGGYIPAPPAYLQHLRKVCDEHGIVLVADEIQTGFGRTGKTFAIEHSGVVPDVMTIAKGMANGMPISGIVTKKAILDAMPAGSLGGTYSGNVVACAAALATTKYIRTHDILGNVNARSEQVFKGLREIAADSANGGWLIEEIRGQGVSGHLCNLDLHGWQSQLMVAIEFKSPTSKFTSSIPSSLSQSIKLPGNINKLVLDACYDQGLMVLVTSIYPVLRMIPALIVSEEEVDEMLSVMKQAIKEVAKKIEATA
jgi:4-aminobutyrate aminotransferase